MASLFVYMNGVEVGEYIQRRGGDQEFHYARAWYENELAIPLSLSLPLSSPRHRGEAVVNYFNNLLPDNTVIRERIQARFGVTTSRPFDLLAAIGRDCVGAIQLMPEQAQVDVKSITATALSAEAIAEILRNYRSLPLGMSGNEEFRISLAGAQEKTALLWHADSWQRPTGTTPTTHIFKLPVGRIAHGGMDLSDSVENEWLCLELLREFGLPVPRAEIQDFEDVRVLIVERFDRRWSDDGSWIIRRPQEDMCQVTGTSPGLKYESDGGPGVQSIMDVLRASLSVDDDRKRFMCTVFLFYLMGAIDGHAKNHSILLQAQGRFRLAPVYDVISAYPLAASRQLDYRKLKLAMALHGSNTHYAIHEIMPRHWYAEARRANFPESEMRKVIEEVCGQLEAVISRVSARLPIGFPDDIATPIFQGMRDVAGKYT